MEKLSEHHISAGKFANICDTTRDVLRYYDKKGLLVPYKDQNNQYHYYSEAQITSFYFINTFRKLGCSTADIRELLLSDKPEKLRALLAYQHEELEKMKISIEQKIGTLKGAIGILDNIENRHASAPEEETLDRDFKIKRTKICSSNPRHAGDITADLRRHIQLCSDDIRICQFPIGVAIDSDDFFNGRYNYKDVFSLALNSAEGEDIEPMPGRHIVSNVHDNIEKDITFVYEQLLDYIVKNGLKVVSDIFSISLFNTNDIKSNPHYLKYIFAFVD